MRAINQQPDLNFLGSAFDPSSGYDITMRQFLPKALEYGPFGIMRDDSRMRERVEGGARRAPGGTWGYNTGSGSVNIRGMGGGGTPSDPGGYNYATLANVASAPKSFYKGFRGKQQQVQRRQQVAARQQARQQQQAQQAQAQQKTQQLQTFAGNVTRTAQNVQAGLTQGPMVPGASSSARRPGANVEVNLLTGGLPFKGYAAPDSGDDMSWLPGSSQAGGNMSGTFNFEDSMNALWGASSPGIQQGAGMAQGNKRPTGAAGASQRPNQPRNRGRGKSNRGFGKKL